jgi:hypothetical protein
VLWRRRDGAYESLISQIFKIYGMETDYPIEKALRPHHGCDSLRWYYNCTDFNDIDSPAMKLRFWWAYNLAVAYARQLLLDM